MLRKPTMTTVNHTWVVQLRFCLMMEEMPHLPVHLPGSNKFICFGFSSTSSQLSTSQTTWGREAPERRGAFTSEDGTSGSIHEMSIYWAEGQRGWPMPCPAAFSWNYEPRFRCPIASGNEANDWEVSRLAVWLRGLGGCIHWLQQADRLYCRKELFSLD